MKLAMLVNPLALAALVLLAAAPAHAGLFGLILFGSCQAACNAGAVACYSGAGLVFGVSPITLAAAAKCSAAQGVCMAACAAAAANPFF
ncbi:hypothetical protein H9P43_007522 [Blastocladiella emersonii ATCC 22665]|nr:hypothetical protein H9P43_007522 [Blastocladiella emersonii ATCC 22665]